MTTITPEILTFLQAVQRGYGLPPADPAAWTLRQLCKRHGLVECVNKKWIITPAGLKVLKP